MHIIHAVTYTQNKYFKIRAVAMARNNPYYDINVSLAKLIISAKNPHPLIKKTIDRQKFHIYR